MHAAVTGGCDADCPGGSKPVSYPTGLAHAVKTGALAESDLDQAVTRLYVTPTLLTYLPLQLCMSQRFETPELGASLCDHTSSFTLFPSCSSFVCRIRLRPPATFNTQRPSTLNPQPPTKFSHFRPFTFKSTQSRTVQSHTRPYISCFVVRS
jgi:hypothetical protein